MDKKSKTKRNIILIVIISILLIISITGITYAWFSAIVSGNDNATENVVENATLSIEYTNGEELKGENIVPGWSETKSFSVENTGTETATYNITWAKLLNEFINKEDLVYTLTSNNNGGTLSETQLPESGENINILENITIEPNVIQTYTLTITYKNTNYDQSSDINKNLIGKIEVNGGKAEPSTKHTVSLTVLNGTINGDASKEVSPMSQAKFSLTPTSEEYTEAIYSCDDEETITSFIDNNTLSVENVTKDTTCTVEYYIPTSEACFEFDSETGTITAYYDYEGGEESGLECPRDVAIPSKISGITVKAIGDNAFLANTPWFEKITSLKMPSTIETIGDNAFSSNQLATVAIPDNVTTIGRAAFEANQLTTVTIPDSVTTIESGAFADNQLTTITIPDNVTTIGTSVFSGNNLTSIVIPDSVTSIGMVAFSNNQLTSVTIGKNVTYIGPQAFSGNNLTSIVIPDSVTMIDFEAFAYNQLTTVTIPDSVTSIEWGAFYIDSDSNSDLTSIINKTGREFDWGYITSDSSTSDSSGNNFVTGSFTSPTGKTLTVSES